MRQTLRTAVTALIASTMLALGMTSARAISWLDADIGAPTAAGSSTYTGGVLSVTGAGAGDTASGTDQLHYTYTANSGGDVEVIARITSFAAVAHARAGIMLRTSNAASSTTAQIAFCNQDAGDGNNNIDFTAYDLASGKGDSNGVETPMQLPMWLRLDRIANHFAVYKSPDGVIWSMLGNTSGWQFTPAGAFEVGFFASSDTAAATATATFDNISIGAPNLGYTTSWFGNTLGGNVDDGHVSDTITAMWVGADGSCYTNSYYDEGGAPSQVYKDGKVVLTLDSAGDWRNNQAFGNAFCGEGCITSDGSNLYLVAGQGQIIYKCDMVASSASITPIYMAESLWNTAGNINVTSGMAVVGNRLYLGDSSANLIRVAQTSMPIYYTASNSSVDLTTQAITTTGVANAAPESVYQSERECDYLPYQIPGMTPGTNYTVRCHFAEYTETQTGKRLIDIYAGSQSVIGYDVVAAAGGTFKAAVLNIPNVQATSAGVLNLVFSRSSQGGDGHEVICGFEILNPNGTQAFALNCGGLATGGFKSEVYELPGSEFAFTRPGPMTVDSRGDLWIIQEANTFPVGTTMTNAYPGAILCYHTNGTFTGKQITDCANPTALAYDAVNDRLLVADNGPNQNIRFYSGLATAPSYVNSFGEPGGIFADDSGLLNDPNTGGYARFYGLNAVGIDAAGDIYVSSAMQGTDLRAFSPEGELLWMLNGLPFCNCPDVDPATDGMDAYCPYFHATMDYSKTAPGSEWSYTGYNWNASLYGAPPRQSASQSIVRRVGASGAKILYTSGQGALDYIGIYRYVGETVIPCGAIRNGGTQLWIDSNGDGQETASEDTTVATSLWITGVSVDLNGDIWLAGDNGTSWFLRHLLFQGLSAQGVPRYDFNPGDYEDIPFPSIGATYNPWGQYARVDYNSVSDTMYLLGPRSNCDTVHNIDLSYLARYDNWSTGNRTATWLVPLPDPSTDPNFPYDSQAGLPAGCTFTWMGLNVAANRIFIAELWGPVHVFDTATGSLVSILNPGPEVSGGCAWEDASMGLRAFQRENGEMIVFTENSGYDGKCNMFRIPPPSANLPPVVSITNPGDGTLFPAPASLTISAQAEDSDGTVSKVDFYQGATLLGTCTARPYSFSWNNVPSGIYTLTAIATDNDGATSASSVTITVVPHLPPTVSITAPYTGATDAAPASVAITATASAGAGAISRVDFYQGSTWLGSSTTPPYTFTWMNVPVGAYTLTAVATDSAGLVSTSAMVNIAVDNLAVTDLFAGLNVGAVPSGQNGWTRNPTTDNANEQMDFTATAGAPPVSPCMAVTAKASMPPVLPHRVVTAEEFSTYQNGYRDLGTNTGLAYWAVGGQLCFAYANLTDKRAQFRLLVNDVNGNTIAMLDRLTSNLAGDYDYLQFNGQDVITCGWPDTTAIDNLCDVWNPISIAAINGNVQLSYGGYTFTAAPLAGSTLGSPQTLVIQVGTSNYYGDTLYLDTMTFSTGTTVNSVLPTVSIATPSNYAEYNAPATVNLTASAASLAGSIRHVAFYQGSTLLGTAISSPYSYVWQNVPAGSYALTAVATDNLGQTVTSPAVHISVNPPVIASVTPSSGEPGTVVTISGVHFTGATAVAFGGTAAATFSLVNDHTLSATVGNGASGAITVTTSAGTASSSGVFTFIPPLTAVTLATTPASPKPANTTILLTATATGGANVLYKFWLYNPAATPTWSELQAGSTSATCSWTPATAGDYLLDVTAQDGSSYTEMTATCWYAVASQTLLTAVTITTAPTAPQQVLTPITITASAVGGANVSYQCWLYNPAAIPTWSPLQAFSSTATCCWTPAVAGNYLLSVTAQDGVIGAQVNAFCWYTVTSSPPLTAVSLATNPAAPQTANTSTTLTASATGGANIQYKFWIYNPATLPTWNQLQAYSTSATCNWTPAAEGNYLLVATARDGEIGTEVSTTLWDTISDLALTVTASPPSPQQVATPVTFTATASGGASVQYQFWLYNPAASPAWSPLQAFSSSATCKWTPATAGNYLCSVTAQDGVTGVEVNATCWYTVTNGPPLTAVAIGAAPTSPQQAGTSILLTATPTGGTSVQYQFWVYNADVTPTWSPLQAYSLASSCNWTPGTAGNYLLSVTARDGVVGTEVNTTMWYTIN